MIRTIDIDINAANPDLPLAPFKAYVTSPSAIRIRNVPRRIGSWEINSVQFTVNYPDNTSRSVVCKLTAGVWVGTVVGSASTGSSTNGFAVTASGTDENGYAVTGYILGKGDVLILATDGTVTIGETTYYVHLLDAQPTTPHKGDLCLINNAWKIYNGSAWVSFGGGIGDITHSEFSDVTALVDRYTLADVKGKVNEVLNILKGSALALILLCSSASLPTLAAIETQTARLDALYNDSLVVTNVTGGGIDTNAVNDIIASSNLVTKAVTNALSERVTGLATTTATHTATLSSHTSQLSQLSQSKRDLTNNVCAADSFTPWGATLPSGYTFGDAQPAFDSTAEKWTWYVEGASTSVDAESGASTASATSVTFSFVDGSTTPSTTITFPATRARAAHSNDTFTTYTFVTNAVATLAPAPDFTTNNAVLVSTITNVAGKAGGGTASGINLHDAGLGCDWQLSVSNSVFTWTVKED